MLRCSSALALLIFALPVSAQEVIAPGHPDLDVSLLQPGSHEYAIIIVQGPNRQPFGTSTSTLTVNEEDGVADHVLTMEMMGRKFTDSSRVAWPSLTALAYAAENQQGRARFTVTDGVLSGEREPQSGGAETFEMALDSPVFAGSWVGNVARSLPLAEGYTATIAAFDTDFATDGLSTFTVTVTGEDTVPGFDGKPTEVWILDLDTPNNQEQQFYIGKTQREVLRIRVVPQPGIEVFLEPASLAEADDDK